MEDIIVKDFITKKELLVCYIYGITKNDDGTIKYVHYYKKSDKSDTIIKNWYCSPSAFANYLINGERIAYAGRIETKNGVEVMKAPSLVTIKTEDEKLYLTTASDDSESNNLLNLPEIPDPKK